MLFHNHAVRTVVRSYFPTALPGLSFFPYQVSRVGHVISTKDFVVDRSYFPGTEVLFVVRGRGVASTDRSTSTVAPGNLVWLDNTRPHGHRPDPDDPWELYWLRFECSFMERLNNTLDTSLHPVFSLAQPDKMQTLFEDLFRELERPLFSTQAIVNAAMAQVVAILFESRRDALIDEAGSSIPSERFARLYGQVQRSYHEQWDNERMAREMAVSTAHMYRLFKAAVAMTPHQWLRSVRIEHAKRRLLETDELVGEIAMKVGYRDQFHFSRDFRAVAGESPRGFRKKMLEGE